MKLKDHTCSRGVLLDPALLLDKQVAAVTRCVFARFLLVRQLQAFPRKADLATIIPAVVQSHLDYCNLFHLGLPGKTVWTFQLFQNMAASVLLALVDQSTIQQCAHYVSR